MIQLAMELPVAFRGILNDFCDLDFALAHRVLESEEYTAYYASRGIGRELILDNSMHELGEALPVRDILEAANRVNATYVIAPDRLGDPAWGLAQAREMQDLMPQVLRGNTRLAFVLCGKTENQRWQFLEELRKDSMICLPYREERTEWFRLTMFRGRRLHLLGMSTVEELQKWIVLERELARRGEGVIFSFDTSKPVKWGWAHEWMDKLHNLRGAPLSSRKLLEIDDLTMEELGYMIYNTHFLRRILAGGQR